MKQAVRVHRMDRIRLCIIAPDFWPIWGGLGTYVVELVNHLPRNIEIHVVAPLRESFGKEKLSTSTYDFAKHLGKNVSIHLVSEAHDTFMYHGGFQLACFREVPRLVKNEHIDLIHCSSHIAGLMLELRDLHVPMVTTIHTTIFGQRQGTRASGMSFQELEFSERMTYLGYPLLRLVEILYFCKNRYYITVSEWMRQQLRKREVKNSPISVIHNSVDTRTFCPAEVQKPTKDIVLFTGRMIAAKGIRGLVEAVPRILKEHSEAFFLFIGSGDFSPYRRRLKDLGVPERNFEVLGYLEDRGKLLEYLKFSSVYVAPTLYENLPIRILEAMACGVPVVASNIAAIPEAINDNVNGVLVKPGSVDDLASAVCLLLSDSALRRRIGDAARKTVLTKFDSEVNTSRTAEVYQKVLSQSQLSDA
jgi:glycosyltransferase involved in cell wall biosynthesis